MSRLLATTFLLAAVTVPLTADDKGPAVKFGKLSASVPAGWKVEKPTNRLRSHQFRLPAAEAGVGDAEVIVMPDSNPDPAKSFPRWKESFAQAEGKTVDDAAKASKFEIGGAAVQVLDVTGTWKYKERPFDPKSKEELRPDYRVVWAIITTGDDATHVRLSGPAATVAKRYPEFEAWLKGMK